ncbi:hypothetical protein [Isoptericola sp. NPDC057653]|uniref:hypothetical protein n=1 Tax=unclassified Isoptericola TaxID=2623355 RepID=UPI0036948443
MALGPQKAKSSTLDKFLRWADTNDYRVSEHPDFGGVHPVHAPGSWHFDGLAGDINFGSPGAPPEEREPLLHALDVASSMGLGVIYARDGTEGSASHHKDHLHADCGSTSNVGKGLKAAATGGLLAWRLQRAVHFGPRRRDNLWGVRTDRRLTAVRMASRMHGEKFPHGKRVAQRAVGAPVTGEWGDVERAHHDRTVSAIQRALEVSASASWDDATEAAFLKAQHRLRH